MKSMAYTLVALLLASAGIFSCSKTSPEPVIEGESNQVILEFDNRVGAQKLVLGDTPYKNAFGEEFTVSSLNYYISNVALKKSDGTVVKFPNQYFLIRQVDAATLNPVLKDVPAGDYTEVAFTIGVDSVKSASPIGERTGVLDPNGYKDDNMWWGWSSGYIFVKLEGTSPVVPPNGAGIRRFQLHSGGYGGYSSPSTNNLRTVSLPFPREAASVRKSTAPIIHIITDIQKVFNGNIPLKLAETNAIHEAKAGIPYVNNYMHMFSVDHVHND